MDTDTIYFVAIIAGMVVLPLIAIMAVHVGSRNRRTIASK